MFVLLFGHVHYHRFNGAPVSAQQHNVEKVVNARLSPLHCLQKYLDN